MPLCNNGLAPSAVRASDAGLHSWLYDHPPAHDLPPTQAPCSLSCEPCPPRIYTCRPVQQCLVAQAVLLRPRPAPPGCALTQARPTKLCPSAWVRRLIYTRFAACSFTRPWRLRHTRPLGARAQHRAGAQDRGGGGVLMGLKKKTQLLPPSICAGRTRLWPRPMRTPAAAGLGAHTTAAAALTVTSAAHKIELGRGTNLARAAPGRQHGHTKDREA